MRNKHPLYGDSKLEMVAKLQFRCSSKDVIRNDERVVNMLNNIKNYFTLEEHEFEFKSFMISGNKLVISFVSRPNLAPSQILFDFRRSITSWVKKDKSLKKYLVNGEMFFKKYELEVNR